MVKGFLSGSRSFLLKRLFSFLLFFAPLVVLAHPMPNSLLLMDVGSKGVAVELQLPLSELELAFGNGVATNTSNLVERLGPQLKAYILAHIKPVSKDGKPWTVRVNDLRVGKVEESAAGAYQELTAHLWMEPPAGASTREFTLNYDVIIHQLITHSALVSVRQDWEAGVTEDQPVEVGAISLDVENNVVPPLQVNLGEGSNWQGFKSMVSLGLRHIAEGTDHLMFLLVLLLPAPLLVVGNHWGKFGGVKYSLIRLLRIVTAFTTGHSVTLLFGALGWVRLPGQPVEILIAFSILISAVHALRPLFPGKEIFVAAGFGLIHGLAFAFTLSNLNLAAGPMALSILGFNLGIELMQIFVIALTVPWLFILSKKSVYTYLRIGGALFAAVAAMAWMLQRYLEKDNILATVVEQVAGQGRWIVLGLAVLAIVTYFLPKQTSAQKTA
ncbi:MAG TPA: HupE/UreJ family protein [Flavisolibacter sp.]|nr:HupE/UreJ family protein [Flavisolibacter sp.]